MPRRYRILHAPGNVGGNPYNLSLHEKMMGHHSVSLTLDKTSFSYRVDVSIYHANKWLRFIKCFYWVFFKIIFFDVIHYNFGETIFPMAATSKGKGFAGVIKNLYFKVFSSFDLKLARFLGKIIIVTYQGDDARQGTYCREKYPLHFVHEVEDSYYTQESDKLKAERIKLFDEYSDLIYALNPDLLNVLPKRAKFLPYACVDLSDWNYVGTQSGENFIPHIIHAPSHRGVKGTKYIIDAIEKLKKEGISLKFTLVENLTHDEAKKLYKEADVLIDQLLAGFYGGLAVELMALGKPVICYLRQEDLSFLPTAMSRSIPIINSNPDSIYEDLKSLLQSKTKIKALGEASRKFIEDWHNPSRIVQSIHSDFEALPKKKGST